MLRIIQDLSNNDKHEYFSQDGGHSGKATRVYKFDRVMWMMVKGGKKSFISLTLNHQGFPQQAGLGTAKVIVIGDILDTNGNKIGDLHKTALEAIKVWESVLGDFGMQLWFMLVLARKSVIAARLELTASSQIEVRELSTRAHFFNTLTQTS